MNNLNRDSIKAALNAYFSGKPVLRAFLFGSYATNDARDDSDIDVLVELDYSKGGDSFDNYYRMVLELNELFGRKVDMVSANGISPLIAPFINREKVLVYDAAA